MAQLHNAIRRFGSLIAGVRRMVGGSADVQLERLGETLTPILNPWGLPEWAYPRGEFLLLATRNAGATAAEYSGIAIVNPAGSQCLLVIDAVKGRCDTGNIALTLTYATEASIAATLATSTFAVARDTRTAKGASTARNLGPVMYVGTDPVGWLNELEELFVNATTYSAAISPPYIIRPGVGLVLSGKTVNTAMRGCFVGRWRAALPGELD